MSIAMAPAILSLAHHPSFTAHRPRRLPDDRSGRGHVGALRIGDRLLIGLMESFA